MILDVYGRMVSAGLMRDYAICEARDFVAFDFFKRSSEQPVYRIFKDPKPRKKHSAYTIVGAGGQVLKRGNCLKTLLRFFDPKFIRLVKA